MRDALHGLTRFDEFQESLGIAPNMLARRLKALVAAGPAGTPRLQSPSAALRICAHRARPRVRAVLIALLAFGNRHFAPEGKSVTILDTKTGLEADPVVVDWTTGKPIREPKFAWVPGPAAGERTRQRYARRAPMRLVPVPVGAASGPPAVSPASDNEGPAGGREQHGRTARNSSRRSAK